MSRLAFFAPWILNMKRCWAHRCLLWADALVFTHVSQGSFGPVITIICPAFVELDLAKYRCIAL